MDLSSIQKMLGQGGQGEEKKEILPASSMFRGGGASGPGRTNSSQTLLSKFKRQAPAKPELAMEEDERGPYAGLYDDALRGMREGQA